MSLSCHISQRRTGLHCVQLLRYYELTAFSFKWRPFALPFVCHLGFFKVGNFDCWTCSHGKYASTCQISCWLREPLRRYNRFPIFQNGGRLPSWILKSWNFYCPSGSEGKYASPSQILYRSVEPLRRYGRFSIFQDCGRLPSWICFTCIGPPTKSICWSLSLCKIWLKSVQ